MAQIANKTQLKLDGTSIGNLTSLSYSSSCAEVDITTLDSDFTETAPGLVDYGSVDCELLWAGNISASVGTAGNWAINVAGGNSYVYVFSGFVTKWDISGVEVNGVVKVSLTIRCTSAFGLD